MQASKSTISSLTGSQQSIWASHKIDPHSTSNYLPHTFELSGKIDLYAFKQAFKKLISNNDSLRTIFQENEELEVEQIVLEEMEFTLESIQVPEEGIEAFIDQRVLQPIDIHQRCFDSTLIKLGEEHFIWYLSVHHILADAATLKILFEEMAKLYHAELSHQKVEFQKKSSFQNYREFELEKRNSKNTPSAEYWKSKGQIPDKKLALYGNEKSSKSKARRVKIPIERSLKDSLDEKLNTGGYRSFNPDLTKFTIWSTLFAAFISRISGESNIRLGSPFPNRNLSDFKNTAGLLIEVLPFDIQVTKEDTFQSLFDKVRLELFDFFKNGYPGAQTMENARGIHLVVNYIPIYFGDFGTIPCKTKWLFPGELDPGHQLRLQAFDFNNQSNLDYYFDINEAYFTEYQVELLPHHFMKLFEAFIDEDGSKISEIELVTDLEKSELISKHEGSGSNIPSLDKQLNLTFEQHSNDIALAFGDESISFEELDILIKKACFRLIEKKIKPQDVVVVHKERSPEYIISILAIFRMGATFIPIPVDLPEKRLHGILEDLKPKLIISASSKLGSNYSSADIKLQELRSSETQETELELVTDPIRRAYILFTSGSTGKPKGVEVSSQSLANYLMEAKSLYSKGQKVSMPFFTSIGFDLTITSVFLPLLTGGSIHIYPESKGTSDLSILEVVKNKQINAIKLTPSHARVIQGIELKDTQLQTVIFGGENLETNLALDFQSQLPAVAEIFNEYGPTEATVGCIVQKFDLKEKASTVPIGKPISGCYFYVLDDRLNPVPQGVEGNLYLGGKVLALGYNKNQQLTDGSFIDNPYQEGQKIYKTGDLARLNAHGNLEYLGRVDEQIKLNGVRIESTELELLISKFPSVEEAHIVLADSHDDLFEIPDFYCKNCGIPSTYPDASFNEEGVCNLCESFEEYQTNVSSYFKSFDNLKSEILGLGEEKEKEYDCLMLLSGGKDSSYALAKLVELGLNVLAWTLDNGFISDNAKENIKNTTSKLGVDHVYGRTDAMNAIFRDSLERHQNVCNGCFKTVYTLSTKLAMEKNIPVIVTGLSRGQFFETRLTEELFLKDHFDPADIDNIILETRKSYHRSKDAVSEYLDVSMFETDEVFSKVSFVDFYRFSDVSLSEMIDYLENKIGWKRPKDTGRSTNCIINDLGIYVHKRKKGYHNYAFPYSWDVRVGHKKREETIDELNDELSENAVKELMQEIGMETQGPSKEIITYFKASSQVDKNELIAYLREFLPSNMIPSIYLQIDSFPLTANGKVDKQALLRSQTKTAPPKNKAIVKPKNKIEELVHSTWCSVLKMDSIDVTDSFIPLGGNSLSAIRIVSLLSKRLNLDISIQEFFEQDSIRKLAASIEREIKKRMGIS